QIALAPDRLGERRAALDLVTHRLQRAPEDGVPLPLEHHVERLEQGEPGLEQRRQLLAEDDQQVAGDAPALQAPVPEAKTALDLEQVEALLLEIGAQSGFVRGAEPALDDLAGGGPDLAYVVHGPAWQQFRRDRTRGGRGVRSAWPPAASCRPRPGSRTTSPGP